MVLIGVERLRVAIELGHATMTLSLFSRELSKPINGAFHTVGHKLARVIEGPRNQDNATHPRRDNRLLDLEVGLLVESKLKVD